jgi:hypothetical protein
VDKIKSWLAHTWAALATPIVLATFIGIPFFSRILAEGTGIQVSPWFTGGEVMREIAHEGYRTVLRRPVFDGLIGQRSLGFIQVEWLPEEGAALPDVVEEGIDIDDDGKEELTVRLDTQANRATIDAHSPRVLGLERIYTLQRERVIRVKLRRETAE